MKIEVVAKRYRRVCDESASLKNGIQMLEDDLQNNSSIIPTAFEIVSMEFLLSARRKLRYKLREVRGLRRYLRSESAECLHYLSSLE